MSVYYFNNKKCLSNETLKHFFYYLFFLNKYAPIKAITDPIETIIPLPTAAPVVGILELFVVELLFSLITFHS